MSIPFHIFLNNLTWMSSSVWNCNQNGASWDSSHTSPLPLDASSASSSIEIFIYSRCANRSHFSQCWILTFLFNKKNVISICTPNDITKDGMAYLANEKGVTGFKGHELMKVKEDIERASRELASFLVL